MPRDLKIALGILTVAVLTGLISLRGLHQRMQGLAESQSTEEKARRDVLAPEIKTPTDVSQGARIYWAAGEDRVTSTTVELALSGDPVERGKQVLHALIVDTPSSEQRTIPANAELLAFYILRDGTAVADFPTRFLRKLLPESKASSWSWIQYRARLRTMSRRYAGSRS